MAQIDYFFKRIQKYKASGVVLKSNANAVLQLRSGDRSGNETVSHESLMQLIQEVATPDALADLSMGRNTHFTYKFEGIEYQIKVAVSAKSWNVLLSLKLAKAEDEILPKIEPAAETGSETGSVSREELHHLLTTGVKHKASDIHFRPGAPPCYRVGGSIRPINYRKLTASDTQAITALVCGGVSEKEARAIRESDSSYSVPSVARFRVNIFRQRGSLALVLRIIPSEVPGIESLKMPEVVKTIALNERGLILVTGATGSGKSSTLAAMIDHINRNKSVHILTIEDPIEFLHPDRKAYVSQREIGPDTDSFAIGLRAALRQDPDVILVGEMRDRESIDVALKAAETGHVVFSTVHTTDASKTVNRLCGVFPAEEQDAIRLRLADTLKATISQRLIPRKDGKGRTLVQEIMVATAMMQELIRDNRSDEIKDSIEKDGGQNGMQSFDQHLSQLYREGVVTLEVAKQAASNASDFERALQFS